MSVRAWLQQNQVFDKDLVHLFPEYGVNSPDNDLKLLSVDNWEALKHRLMTDRASELKDNAARQRMQKKLTKIEKLWKATTKSKPKAKTKAKTKTKTKAKPASANTKPEEEEGQEEKKEAELKYKKQIEEFMLSQAESNEIIALLKSEIEKHSEQDGKREETQDALRKEVNRLESAIVTQRHANEEQEKRHADLQEELRKEVDRLQSEVAHQRNSNEEQDKKHADLQEELRKDVDRLQSEMVHQRHTIEEQEKMHIELQEVQRKEVYRLKSEMTDQRHTVEEQEESHAELQEQVESLQLDKNKLIASAQVNSHKVTELTQQVSSLQAKFKKKQAQYSKLLSEYNEYIEQQTEERQSTHDTINSLKQQLEECNAKRIALQEQLDALLNQNEPVQPVDEYFDDDDVDQTNAIPADDQMSVKPRRRKKKPKLKKHRASNAAIARKLAQSKSKREAPFPLIENEPDVESL